MVRISQPTLLLNQAILPLLLSTLKETAPTWPTLTGQGIDVHAELATFFKTAFAWPLTSTPAMTYSAQLSLSTKYHYFTVKDQQTVAQK